MTITKVSYSMISGSPGNVLDFGADSTGVSDSTQAFNNALTQYKTVCVPEGTYKILGTIEPPEGTTLYLDSGVVIQKTSDATNTNPVIYIGQSFVSIIGCGFQNSVIKTQKSCPDGVVKLGTPSMITSPNNVQKCRIDGVGISGSTMGGQTSGSPDIALLMQNCQFDNIHFSYFNYINNVEVGFANIGIELREWANGNYISNIYGVYCGNTSLNPACMFYIHGAQENSITSCFFNSSVDSTFMLVQRYDNTGSGGHLHIPEYNNVSSCITEQGGTSSRSLVIAATGDSVNSYYELVDVTYLGPSLSSDFVSQFNTFISNGYETNYSTVSQQIIAKTYSNVGNIVKYPKYVSNVGTSSILWTAQIETGDNYQPGYFVIRVADINTNASNPSSAWFMYKFFAYQTTLVSATLVDSGGDVSNYTISVSKTSPQTHTMNLYIQISGLTNNGSADIELNWFNGAALIS